MMNDKCQCYIKNDQGEYNIPVKLEDIVKETEIKFVDSWRHATFIGKCQDGGKKCKGEIYYQTAGVYTGDVVLTTDTGDHISKSGQGIHKNSNKDHSLSMVGEFRDDYLFDGQRIDVSHKYNKASVITMQGGLEIQYDKYVNGKKTETFIPAKQDKGVHLYTNRTGTLITYENGVAKSITTLENGKKISTKKIKQNDQKNKQNQLYDEGDKLLNNAGVYDFDLNNLETGNNQKGKCNIM